MLQLYNGKRAAAAIGISEAKLHAMKKAGLVFSHGTLTTLETVLTWMEQHKDFRVTHVYPPRRAEPSNAKTRPGALAYKYGV
jgi:hypothetical protein